jgi:putative oxidoreductase
MPETPKLRSAPTVLGPLLFPAGLAIPTLDAALIVVRVVLTWIFFYYGTGKLFGTFNLGGIHATSQFFSDTAHLHPGGFFAVVAGVIEFAGAIAVAVGLLSRLAALALFVDQVIAMITVTWMNGIGSLTGKTGYEFNITLAALTLVIVLVGAGRVSADHFIARRVLPDRFVRRGSSGAGARGRDPVAPAHPEVASTAGHSDPP